MREKAFGSGRLYGRTRDGRADGGSAGGQPEELAPCATTCWRPTSSTPGSDLRIVDYEGSVPTSRPSNSGNIAQEAHLSPGQLAALVAGYGREDSP